MARTFEEQIGQTKVFIRKDDAWKMKANQILPLPRFLRLAGLARFWRIKLDTVLRFICNNEIKLTSSCATNSARNWVSCFGVCMASACLTSPARRRKFLVIAHVLCSLAQASPPDSKTPSKKNKRNHPIKKFFLSSRERETVSASMRAREV